MSCGGQCCAAFTLTPDLDECLVEGGTRSVLDEEFIADMVIAISAGEALLRHAAFGGTLDISMVGVQYYKCRHWDEETRLCGRYEDRPDMCRRFPYENGCPHGCSCVGKASRDEEE